jgi:ATP/maltotriose-dependent transcriptional regulator MalT
MLHRGVAAALQSIDANIGEGVIGALQSSQPAPPESILTALLNELTAITRPFVLVLDDYHLLAGEVTLGLYLIAKGFKPSPSVMEAATAAA